LTETLKITIDESNLSGDEPSVVNCCWIANSN